MEGTPLTTIRPAVENDAEGIARVHITSWQETYGGLLPKTFLSNLPSSLQDRTHRWKNTLVRHEYPIFVAERSDAIVGFCTVCPARDEAYEEHGELSAIYILKNFQKNGTGKKLLHRAMGAIRGLGFQKAYCWVLEGNPAAGFYEKHGGVPTKKEKVDEIGGQTVKEILYLWETIHSYSHDEE